MNRRLKEVDEERTSLSDSLERQAAALTEGDNQFNLYRMMHNLAFAVPPRRESDVRVDAVEQLTSALTKYYQAAYDIPQTAITETENEDFGMRLPLMEKDLQLARKWMRQALRKGRGCKRIRRLAQAIASAKVRFGSKASRIPRRFRYRRVLRERSRALLRFATGDEILPGRNGEEHRKRSAIEFANCKPPEHRS